MGKPVGRRTAHRCMNCIHAEPARFAVPKPHLAARPARRPLEGHPGTTTPRMSKKQRTSAVMASGSIRSGRKPLRVGFVPLNDCAPLAVANELGFFRRFGVEVELSRELGWATIRDKLAYGELEAAHAPCGLPASLAAGENCAPTDTVAALVLSVNGNAVTLSEGLWEAGVRDAATMQAFLASRRGGDPLTFGIVSPCSTHGYLLRRWLRQAGAQIERDVRFVVAPPPQMPANLAAGHLDGFCAGEPWNSVAVARREGWIAATSADLAPGHPEKVLAARADFAARQPEEHLRLVAALREACAVCDDLARVAEVVEILRLRRYVGQPAEILRRGFPGEFDLGHGRRALSPDFVRFERGNANAPTPERAAWTARCVGPAGAGSAPLFRMDLYAKACALRAEVMQYDLEPQTSFAAR